MEDKQSDQMKEMEGRYLGIDGRERFSQHEHPPGTALDNGNMEGKSLPQLHDSRLRRSALLHLSCFRGPVLKLLPFTQESLDSCQKLMSVTWVWLEVQQAMYVMTKIVETLWSN